MADKEKPVQIKVGEHTLTLALDIPAMRRLRRYPEPIDINKVLDRSAPNGGLFGDMMENPGIAVDIAFEATANDANRPNDPEQFAAGLAGDQLHAIQDAAIEAIIRFTPGPSVRAALKAIKDKAAQREDAIGDALDQAIKDGTFDKAIDEAIEQIEKDAPKTAGAVFMDQKTTKPKSKSKSKTGSSKPVQSSGSTTSNPPTPSPT